MKPMSLHVRELQLSLLPLWRRLQDLKESSNRLRPSFDAFVLSVYREPGCFAVHMPSSLRRAALSSSSIGAQLYSQVLHFGYRLQPEECSHSCAEPRSGSIALSLSIRRAGERSSYCLPFSNVSSCTLISWNGHLGSEPLQHVHCWQVREAEEAMLDVFP